MTPSKFSSSFSSIFRPAPEPDKKSELVSQRSETSSSSTSTYTSVESVSYSTVSPVSISKASNQDAQPSSVDTRPKVSSSKLFSENGKMGENISSRIQVSMEDTVMTPERLESPRGVEEHDVQLTELSTSNVLKKPETGSSGALVRADFLTSLSNTNKPFMSVEEKGLENFGPEISATKEAKVLKPLPVILTSVPSLDKVPSKSILKSPKSSFAGSEFSENSPESESKATDVDSQLPRRIQLSRMAMNRFQQDSPQSGISVVETIKSEWAASTPMTALSQNLTTTMRGLVTDPTHIEKHLEAQWFDVFYFVCSCFPILQPTDRIITNWDMVMSFLLLVVAILIPFDTAFLELSFDKAGVGLFALNRFMDLLFTIDMVIQFHLAIPMSSGKLTQNRTYIQRKYLKGWFIIDLVSLFPYEIIGLFFEAEEASSLQVLRAVRLMRLFKLLRLLRANRVLKRLEMRTTINYKAVQLYGFLFALIMICHWLACGWYLVRVLEDNQTCISMDDVECCLNWFDCFIQSTPPEDSSLGRKYFLALTWAADEVLTIGSAIDAVTDMERSYVMISRCLAGVIYAVLLAAVCGIFMSASRENSQHLEEMDQLNGHLKSTGLLRTHPNFCIDLRTFFTFAHSHRRQVDEVLVKLSPSLRRQLASQIHAKWLLNMDLFEGMDMDSEFYVSLALQLKTKLFAPLERVVSFHDTAESIYIVISGLLFTRGGKSKVAGEVFGEDAVASWRAGMTRGYNATSMGHGQLYELGIQELFRIINSPQFETQMRLVLRRITKLKTNKLLVFYSQLLKVACKESPSFDHAVHSVLDQLPFVKDGAKLPIIKMVYECYKSRRSRDTSSVVFSTLFREMSQKGVVSKQLQGALGPRISRIMRHSVRFQEMSMLLQPFNLQKLVWKLIEDEDLDGPTLVRLTVDQLHTVGFPMGKAVRFAQSHTSVRQKLMQFCSPEDGDEEDQL